jgi:hypothetical protein
MIRWLPVFYIPISGLKSIIQFIRHMIVIQLFLGSFVLDDQQMSIALYCVGQNDCNAYSICNLFFDSVAVEQLFPYMHERGQH